MRALLWFLRPPCVRRADEPRTSTPQVWAGWCLSTPSRATMRAGIAWTTVTPVGGDRRVPPACRVRLCCWPRERLHLAGCTASLTPAPVHAIQTRAHSSACGTAQNATRALTLSPPRSCARQAPTNGTLTPHSTPAPPPPRPLSPGSIIPDLPAIIPDWIPGVWFVLALV